MKYAQIGSISSGTLRTEDLLDAFADALEDCVQRNADEWCSDAGRTARDHYIQLVWLARECIPHGVVVETHRCACTEPAELHTQE